MLLTEGIKAIIDSIKELNKLSSRVLLHDLVEALNIDENDCDLSLGF